MLLNKVEAILRDREEFKVLEHLVSRLQAFIMVNKLGTNNRQFSADEILLVRELFGFKPGEPLPHQVANVSPLIHEREVSVMQMQSEMESHKLTLQALRDKTIKVS